MQPIFETKRLYFKPFALEDLDLLYKIRGNAEVMQFIPKE
jgi:RimJ/RimL family protein N-acetyltransferase